MLIEPPVEPPLMESRRLAALDATDAMCLLIGSLKVVDATMGWVVAATADLAIDAAKSEPVEAVAPAHLDSPELCKDCCDGAE